jgi:hypothetical protein
MRLAMLRMVKLRGATSPRSTSSQVQGAKTGAWSCTNSVSNGGMFDMLQLVGEVGKKRLLRMQERRYLSLPKVSIPSLDDKLKLVGHCGMFDMLQLVGEVGKKRLPGCKNVGISVYAR